MTASTFYDVCRRLHAADPDAFRALLEALEDGKKQALTGDRVAVAEYAGRVIGCADLMRAAIGDGK